MAVKVLPQSLAADPDRLARFQREAEVLAALNHTNIAHIYGLEDAGGVKALVMELVEGPTLADRIAQGPVPIDEALSIAKQIADALEAAHERGITPGRILPGQYFYAAPGNGRTYDIAPDGRRFLMIKEGGGNEPAPQNLVVVQHWFEELKRLVPTN